MKDEHRVVHSSARVAPWCAEGDVVDAELGEGFPAGEAEVPQYDVGSGARGLCVQARDRQEEDQSRRKFHLVITTEARGILRCGARAELIAGPRIWTALRGAPLDWFARPPNRTYNP